MLRYSQKENVTNHDANVCLARVAGYAMILALHVAMIRARPNYHAAHRSSKIMYDMKIKS